MSCDWTKLPHCIPEEGVNTPRSGYNLIYGPANLVVLYTTEITSTGNPYGTLITIQAKTLRPRNKLLCWEDITAGDLEVPHLLELA